MPPWPTSATDMDLNSPNWNVNRLDNLMNSAMVAATGPNLQAEVAFLAGIPFQGIRDALEEFLILAALGSDTGR